MAKLSRRVLRSKTTGPKTRSKIKKVNARLLSKTKEENRVFAKCRAVHLIRLARMLRKNDPDLDLELRPIAKKFASLSFAYIHDCCTGHISRDSFGDRPISLDKLKPGQKVYCSGADFEIVLNNSPVSEEFRKALAEIPKRLPFVWGEFAPLLCIISVTGSTGKKVPKSHAAKMRKRNLQFLHDFEKLVDSFVKKYGVRARL